MNAVNLDFCDVAALARKRHRDPSFALMACALMDFLGLRIAQAEALMAILAWPGRRVPIAELRYLLNSHRAPTVGAIHERMRGLRDAMEPECVDSGGQFDATGYAITEVGLAECARALRAAAETLSLAASGLDERAAAMLDEVARMAAPAGP